ncbi:MAG TPA: hypothetical protein VG389_09550 [Myxococcota bacterium]|nr:hypothetical protein [Myxococcota bacterium]
MAIRIPVLVLALALPLGLGCRGGGREDVPRTTCGYEGADRDGDGLPDEVEDLDGDGEWDFGECDPLSPDSDGDGLVDSIEIGCDGRWQMGVDTRCDVRDTDGDGLDDGVEDADRDGLFEPATGETSPVLADTDGDGCTDGAEGTYTDPNRADTDGDGLADGAENPNCDRIVTDALCETDPTNPDTDGDGVLDADVRCPSEICFLAPLTRRAVTYADSDAGGWKLALPAGPAAEPTAYQEATLAGAGGPGDVRAAGVADVHFTAPDGGTGRLLAFVAAVPLAGTNVADATSARGLVLARLAAAWPAAGDALAVRARGEAAVSWDGAPLARLVTLALDQSGATVPREGGALRRAALAALLGGGLAPGDVGETLPGAGPGAGGAAVVLVLAATVRAPDRLVVVGALADAAAWGDDASGVRSVAEDLGGGASLAQPGDGETEWCSDVYTFSEAAVDLVLVVDPAALPAAPLGATWADALYARAARTRTALRVGVTDMNDVNGGAFCPMGGDSFLLAPDAGMLDACLAAPWTGGAVDPAAHRGDETARLAVIAHLPRALGGQPGRIALSAALGVVFLAAAPAQGLIDLFGPAPSAADIAAYVAADAALYAGAGDAAALPPGTPPAQAAAALGALLDGADAAGVPGYLPGYGELVDALGGPTAPAGGTAAADVAAAALLLDAVDRLAARGAPFAVPPAALPPGLSCNFEYAELPRARDGGFDYDPVSGGVLFSVPSFGGYERGCYARVWVDRTP